MSLPSATSAPRRRRGTGAAVRALAALCLAAAGGGASAAALRRRGRGAGAGAGSGAGSGAGAGAGRHLVTGAGGHLVNTASGHLVATAGHVDAAHGGLGSTGAAEQALVSGLLSDAGPANSPQGGTLQEMVRQKAATMDLDAAVKQVSAPPEVVAMLKGDRASRQAGSSPEDAVKMMNKMLLRSQERLDEKVVECQAFRKKTALSSQQVSKDLARLGQQLANNARIMTTAMGSIDEATRKAQGLKEEAVSQEMAYQQMKKIDGMQYDQRKQDLQDAEFILDLTRCPGSLLDQGSAASVRTSSTTFHVCYDKDHKAGQVVDDDDQQVLPKAVRFLDPRLASAAAKLSPTAQALMRTALGRMDLAGGDANAAAAIRALGGKPDFDGLEDGDEELGDSLATEEAGMASAFRTRARDLAAKTHGTFGSQRRMTPRGALALLAMQQGPMEPPATVAPQPLNIDENKQAQKCVALQPGCGVLHDAFASLWGDLKDLVDESRAKLYQDDEEWHEQRERNNNQLESAAAQKSVLQTDLAEAMSAKSSYADQQAARVSEQRSLTTMIQRTMAECEEAVREIVFTEMAAAIRVRNEIVNTQIDGVEVGDVVDCKVGNWIPGECPIQCDDTLQGGVQILRREIVVKGNSWGMECPSLNYTSRCAQVKCPIDCKLSDWSEFSKCTKECDGGVQSRTRMQLEMPRYGGQSCDAMQESRPCNTGSCDRDCVLGDWQEWSTCSKVCDSGFREREKEVITPIRAAGTCPDKDNAKRWQSMVCNERSCIGDEVCIANMDLVVAIDGSGSMTEDGFAVLKEYAARLVQRFRNTAFGHEASRVAVVQFGNGKLDADKVVSDGILVNKLSDNMEEVAGKIMGMTWQKGFTNLAQGILKAKDALFNGRSKAEHVIVVVTDGRPTFKNQATQAVQLVRQSARLVIVHVQAFRKKSAEMLLKSYASTPWATNYIHIPGKEALSTAFNKYVGMSLVEICPRAMSPSRIADADLMRGYGMVREGFYCGPGAESTTVATEEDCKNFANEKLPDTWKSFAFSLEKCQVYTEECKEFQASTKYNTYDRVVPTTTTSSAAL